MKQRSFRPPPTCNKCQLRPLLGTTLLHTGTVWICAQCLTESLPGKDTMSKLAPSAVDSDRNRAQARHAKARGDIELALALEEDAEWHRQAAAALYDHGTELARTAEIVNTEVVPMQNGYLKNTLADPELAAIESSETRGYLLKGNDIVALGVDLANTVRAANTAEKLVAHQIALAHKHAMEQARQSGFERDPAMQIKRLQISARMMTTAQEGLLTLHKLKSGGTQNVVVQHVHVESGGQAVVGNVQGSKRLSE